MEEKTGLTVLERAAVALGAAEHEKALIELAKKYSDIVEIKNPAGRDQVHAAYMTLKNARIAIEKAGKDARDDAVKFGKAVIAEEKRLIDITQAEEARLQKLRDTWDAAVEVERQAKAAAEKARVDAIRAKIGHIKDCIVFAMGKSAGEIQGAIDELFSHEITLEEFEEFAGEADMAKCAALGKLQDALVAQQAHEAEQARLAAEREALERERAALAEQARLAAVAQAEREAVEREARRIADEEQRLVQERAAEAMRKQQEEHDARMAEQRSEIAKQQAELVAAQAEQARIARQATEAAEAAERAEAQRIADEQAAEAARIQSEQDALEAERLRREHINFLQVGPGDQEIIALVAKNYSVPYQTACNWIAKIKFVDFAVAEEKAA